MEPYNQNEERYRKALKRVEDIKGFYGNVGAYISVNIGFIIINLLTSPNHLWFFWPMLGWGIGVIFHGMKVFNYVPFLGKDWEERKMKQFLEEEQHNKDLWQ